MINFNDLMALLDWHNDPLIQQRGIDLARKLESIEPFLQPLSDSYSKNVWDNCALIVSERSDRTLGPYLIQLLEWVQDLNWPGAFCILDRLTQYSDKSSFDSAYDACMERAQAEDDRPWIDNLLELKRRMLCLDNGTEKMQQDF